MRRVIIAAIVLALLPMQAQALSTDDLLAFVAMPLAVAAVSELTGVPSDDLASLAATLNNAAVPPAQFIEVIRYVPVALVVEDDRADFLQFLRTQTDQGLRGDALVTVIEQRLQTYEPAVVLETRPATQVVVVDETFIPAVVRTRVERARTHPHGGPPGQLKKQLGVQTGAEVVHRDKPGRKVKETRVRVVETPRPMVSSSPSDDRGKDKDRGKAKDDGKGKGHDHGKGKAKGKG